MTLADLFSDLDGTQYDNRQALVADVIAVFNRHLGDLPIGFSYQDAIDGARREGWLKTDETATGIVIRVGVAA